MLTEYLNNRSTPPIFLPADAFNPFPKAGQRSRWDSVPREAASVWIQAAQPYIGYAWPALPAARYALFKQKGDLMAYLNLYWQRRSALGFLLTAELLEGEGRYFDDIVNGIFAICEETTWVIPHHNAHLKDSVSECLPDAADRDVELASAETGALLALAGYLFKEAFERFSPRLCSRIAQEVRTRLIEPYLARDDYWWMGFGGQKHVNNWNPWCHSNVLVCLLFLEQDEETRTAGIRKAMLSLDEYIRRYPADGCCDEGPMYWEASGGGLYRCLDLLYRASGGAVDVFSDPHIRQIGQYIYRVHIHGRYFANFADGDAIVHVGSSAFGYGRRIGDERLVRLGASAPIREPDAFNWFSLYKVLSGLFDADTIAAMQQDGAPYVRQAWMPCKQVMTAREREGSEQGLYLAAKGGDNDESHNHNDVGQFIVYADGMPVLIDLGTENYRAQTFSPQRYELWYLQSQYHNLPTVGGVMQQNGERYRATNAECHLSDERAELKLDLASAYPEQAGIDTWLRSCALLRGTTPEIRITDQYALRQPVTELTYNLITPCEPIADGQATVRLTYAPGREAVLSFDGERLSCRFERIPLEDERLRGNWEERVYRIVLTEKAPVQAGTRTLKIAVAHGRG